MLRVLSLGAGVQSSTLALMIEHGLVAPVDCAIFADTQWEPPEVYEWLDYLEKQVSFPIYRVTEGNLREAVLKNAKRSVTYKERYISIPVFVVQPNGDRGMVRRQCTHEFKVKPINKKKRELLGYQPKMRIPPNSCTTLLGISLDEHHRARISEDAWNTNEYPLIELNMTRWDCMLWLHRNGYPQPPKSSCIGCPFHSDHEWRKIKSNPTTWKDAVEMDEAIRHVPGMRGTQYLHHSCQPLATADLATEEDYGQLSLFGQECCGLCGT